MQLRNEIGQYGRKPRSFIKETFIVLALLIVLVGCIWFYGVQAQYNALDKAGEITKSATSTRPSLNEATQKFIKERTKEAMEDPVNIKWYEEQMENKVTVGLNILTSQNLKEYIKN